MRLALVPLTFREAVRLVADHHRHRLSPSRGLFAIGAATNGEVGGVVIVGRPWVDLHPLQAKLRWEVAAWTADSTKCRAHA
jgi:hypothetical protein